MRVSWAYLVALVAVALSVPGILLGLRQRHLRGLALRRLASSRAETLAAVGAIGLSVSLFVAAFLIAESLGASIAALADSRLGPVDVSITLRGPAARAGASEIRSALEGLGGNGSTIVRAVQVTVVTAGAGEDSDPPGSVLAEPRAVAFDYRYEELSSFALGRPTGLPPRGPAEGEIYVSRDLARTLGLGEGSEVSLIVGGRKDEFRVQAVLPPQGLSGYWEDADAPPLSVFVPSGYLEEIPAVTEVLVNVGTPDGVSPEEARDRAEAVLTPLKDVFDSLTERGTRPAIRYRKADLLGASRAIEGTQTSQLIELGSFAFLSALGLLSTVLYLTISERKRLSGILRAVGMRRRDVLAVHQLSSLAMCVPGLVLGVVLGVGVARVAVWVAGEAISLRLGAFEPVLSVPLWVLVSATATGVAVTSLFSAVVAGIELSSYPAESISGRERPLGLPRVILLGAGAFLAAFGAIATLVDWRSKNPTFIFLGPPIAAAGVATVAMATPLRRVVGGLAGAFTAIWIIYVEVVYGGGLAPPEFRALPIVVAAALLAGTVGTLAATLGPAEAIIRRLLDASDRTYVGLRTAVRDLAVRRGATWFVVQTSAAAVAVLAMVLGVFALESGDVARLERQQLGTWDGVVALRNRGGADSAFKVLEALEASGAGGPEAEAVSLRVGQKFLRVVAGGREVTRVYEIPPEVAAGEGAGFIPLVGRSNRFSSDRDAWESLFDENPPEGRRWVIMSRGAVDLGLVSPASAQLVDPESQKAYGLAGITASNDLIPGVYVSPAAFEEMVKSSESEAVLFKMGRRPQDSRALSTRLQGRLLEDGAAVRIASLVVEERLLVRRFVAAMLQVYLSLGLLVAFAGQAAIVTRAVRARVKSLAVLRATGAARREVFGSVLFEGVVMAAMGATAGTIVGSAVAARLYERGGGGLGPQALLSTAAFLIVGSTVVVALASLLPARSAARTFPASVLRNPDE